jgi:hypothetical protein
VSGLDELDLVPGTPERAKHPVDAIAGVAEIVRTPRAWSRSTKKSPTVCVMRSPLPLEELHGPLVLFRGGTRIKRPEIPPAPRLRVSFARIKPVLSRPELADHVSLYANRVPAPRELHAAALVL